MNFNKLTPKDTVEIVKAYTYLPRKVADAQLSEKFDVSERTIRNWARNLGLTGDVATTLKDIEVEITNSDDTEPEEEPLYYWNLLSEEAQTLPETKEFQPIFYEEGGKRVLVIGDLHTPFDLLEYLHHCKLIYDTYQCDTVVFIGDIVDNHYPSYHGTDPDGLGGADELDFSKARVARYREVFPEAYVIIGNHDRMAYRKAFSGGVPKQWIKEYSEVLEVPGWKFVTHLELDNVLYFHGEGGTAKTKYKSEEQSVVQGHLHTQGYIEWLFSANSRKFAMQVGTGIDFSEYAFAYAKAGKKPAVSCGVVLNGTRAYLEPMIL